MESVMKKIFSGKTDDEVHGDFIKYSRGLFSDKYLIAAKKQKDKWSIKTGPEYVNYLVKKCLSSVSGKIRVKGAIISTLDLQSKIDFPIENVKQFMGVKQVIIDTDLEVEKIKKLMLEFPRAFFALTFSVGNTELKVKAKAPKSSKPSSGGDKEATADFASLKTTDKTIIEDLFFDFPSFDEINIRHSIQITDIVLPKGEKDPVKLRENAVRKGVIKRIIKVDGREKTEEAKFEA